MKGNLRLPTQGTKGNSPPRDPAFHCSGSKCLKCHPVHYTCKFPFLACSLAFLNRSFVFFHPEPFRSLKILSKNYRNIKTGWLIQWMSPSEDPNLHDLVTSGYSLCHFNYFGGKKANLLHSTWVSRHKRWLSYRLLFVLPDIVFNKYFSVYSVQQVKRP